MKMNVFIWHLKVRQLCKDSFFLSGEVLHKVQGVIKALHCFSCGYFLFALRNLTQKKPCVNTVFHNMAF